MKKVAAILFVLFPYLYTTTSTSAELFFRLLRPDDQPRKFSTSVLRPAASDHVPVDKLLESKNKMYDPSASDLNISQLVRQLGSDLDLEYMSVYDPTLTSTVETTFIALKKGRPKGRRPRFLSLLRSARLQDGSIIHLTSSKKERRKFQKYLWTLTFCPVVHTWKYLGIRFWPHWIKEGKCTKSRSCSLPEGMTCKPSGTAYKTFLRWNCMDFREKTSCSWIPIKYPVITSCSCSC